MEIDPDFARQMFEFGANFVLLGVPKGTEFGIDLNSWKVGEKFKGVKMIPPGIHMIYFSAVSKDGDVAPRTGLFHNFEEKEVVVYKYDQTVEDIFVESDNDQIARIQLNLRNLNQDMGPYPLNSWPKWISLIQHMKPDDVKRLQPISGKICSAGELVYNDQSSETTSQEKENLSDVQPIPSSDEPESIIDPKTSNHSTQERKRSSYTSQLPDMKPRPGTELRFTELPAKPYPDGATPQEITRGSMDSSYSLECIFSHLNSPEDILSELQFVFICFLVGQVWEGWEHWRLLIITLCRGEDCLIKNPQLFIKLLSCLHFQIEEVPDDLFLDIVEQKNFLAASLTTLFSNIKDNSAELPPDLVSKAKRFKKHLMSKFKWNLTLEDDEEDAPVVVELP